MADTQKSIATLQELLDKRTDLMWDYITEKISGVPTVGYTEKKIAKLYFEIKELQNG